MDDITHTQTHDGLLKNGADVSEVATCPDGSSSSRTQEANFGGDGVAERDGDAEARAAQPKRRRFGLRKREQSHSHTHYRVYKRRWLGLAQLVLLNIVVSWDVGTTSQCLLWLMDPEDRSL
jgi:FLVCR family MFS transporter 7